MGHARKTRLTDLIHRPGDKKYGITIYLFAGLMLCILLYCTLTGILLLNVRNNLLSGKSHLFSAYSSANEGNLKEARQQFKQAEDCLSSADSSMNSKLVIPLLYIPAIGNNIKAVCSLSEAGFHTASAGSLISDTMLGGLPEESKENVKIELISEGRVNIDALNLLKKNIPGISNHINMANQAYDAMPKTMLISVLDDASDKFGENIPKLRAVFEVFESILGILPDVLGEKGERRYFLAIQNNAELRATGGIIGNYGIITVNNGKMSLEEFNEIHILQKDDLEPVEMPQKYMLRYGRYNSNELWLNVNMSPDFPTTGYIASELYGNATGRKIDGVIGIDPVALKNILRALGSVEVVNADKQVIRIDADNAIEETLVKAYSQYAERKERKGFLSDVAKAVWARLLTGDFDVTEVLKQIGLSLDEKHMALYSKHVEEQKMIKKLGYDGSIRKTTGDYFQAVLQNHGANKLDIYTYFDIDYQVSLGKDGSAKVAARISIENKAPVNTLPDYVTGESDVVPRGYANIWLSVFVPKAAQLKSAVENDRELQVDIGKEQDKTVYSQYVKIKPGAKSVVKFIYKIPGAVTMGDNGPEYILDIQAQPVINAPPFTFSLNAPAGIESVPDGCKREGNKVLYKTRLTKDNKLRFGLIGEK